MPDDPRAIAHATYAVKNANHKESRLKDKKTYRNGRIARKLVTHNGCFGDREPKIWNLLIIGTTGFQRDKED